MRDASRSHNAMDVDIRLLTSADYRAKLNQCIHCGMCLEVCPTYAVLHKETDSPRGRIALMRAAAGGRIVPGEFQGALARHIDLCLTCRACETACPSGVRYGALVDAMRQVIETGRPRRLPERFLRWAALRQLLPHLSRLKALARALRAYQALGLARLVQALPWPHALKNAEHLLPPLAVRYQDYRLPASAIPAADTRGRVAFFPGCIQEAFLAPVNQATIRVLQRNGYEVHVPAGQTCCGAAHLHTGERELACALARQNIDALLAEDFDAVVENAGGCGAMLRDEYPRLLEGDPVYAERARQLAAKVQDISEFVAQHLNHPPAGSVPARAVYSDSCHLRHVQQVARQPRDLLRQVPGLVLVELEHPDRCCGSAGVYNLVHPDIAAEVLDLKMADIAATGADLIVTSNTGCHLQLLAGARQKGLPTRVLHVAQVLDLSYQAEDQANGRSKP